MEYLTSAWPCYVAGPIIGLTVPLLLWLGNKQFGISSSLRHICAACMPANIPFFKYDWKAESWNLFFVAGIFLGGVLAALFFSSDAPVGISESTRNYLGQMGVQDYAGIIPTDLFSWESLLTLRGFIIMVVGGFLAGFGTRYAGGCTSGHAIMGLSNLQLPSLIAVIGFFIGGLAMTHLLMPLIF
ncbi:MAG: YeeE/YedE family protein [Cyclobacteriaceae bacterium]